MYIASGCTEEFSGEGAPLTAAWLKEQGVHLKFLIDEGGMILDEPIGGVKGTYAMVGVLEKGYGDLKFTARGKGGHASAPRPEHASGTAGTVHGGGGEKISLYQPVQPAVLEMFRRLTPNMVFGMKLVFANLWLFKPLLIKLMPLISRPARPCCIPPSPLPWQRARTA